MKEKIWELANYDEQKTAALQASLGIQKILCQILVSRGIDTYDKAKDFFRPFLSQLHNPFLMLDMDKAVDRITQAIQKNEHIRIYGDYDVDGTTAVAVVYSFLIKKVADPSLLSYYVPNRYKEGYGISQQGIDDAVTSGCTLMIALDCGIKANAMADYAHSLGLELIICDHHLPGTALPNATAILNPKQEGCHYPYKELSGCGIGFKLISALAQRWNCAEMIYEKLDLVAASIASDIVPMTGENRILAFYGLQKVNENPCLAIQVLKETSGVRSKMNISNLVFIIGPRINAAGRMNDAKKAIDLFVTDDKDTAISIARVLQTDNKERIDLDRNITQEALDMLDNPNMQSKKSIVLQNESWHKGVVGIVASRVVEYHYKPTIILTTSNDMISGSARSVVGFDIHEAISACAAYLENYGGHQFAAGLTLRPEQLIPFEEAFEKVVQDTITEDSLHPKIYADAMITLDQVNLSNLKILEQFEPCGPLNAAPIFICKGVKDTGKSKIVKDIHLQLFLKQGHHEVKGIAFGMAEWLPILQSGKAIDIVFHIDRNEWNGNVNAEIRVLDIKLTE